MTLFATTAIEAARLAAAILNDNSGPDREDPEVSEEHRYDLKLELDVRCQDVITAHLLAAFADHAIFGEEGLAGNQESSYQWIVDPIDGTVNFFYGIPHYCVSIALRHEGEIILGVILDPTRDELWLAEDGKATLNGHPISCSKRDQPSQAAVTIGFAKSGESMESGFRRYKIMATRVRKSRMMGSAALAMAYIACGRLDAYIEQQISIWDIAAGLLLIEYAGGTTTLRPLPPEIGDEKYTILASNAPLHQFCIDSMDEADQADKASS